MTHKKKRGQCRHCGGRFDLQGPQGRNPGHLINHQAAYWPDYRCRGSQCAPGRPGPLSVAAAAGYDDRYFVVSVASDYGQHERAAVHVRALKLSKTARARLYRAVERAVREAFT